MPSVYTFGDGRLYARFDNDKDLGFLDQRCSVLLPAGFNKPTIPDEHIGPTMDVDMNRAHVNRWWAGYRKRAA